MADSHGVQPASALPIDFVYALAPLAFLSFLIHSQSSLTPHDPLDYTSNLLPLIQVHLVLATLESAGTVARSNDKNYKVAATSESVVTAKGRSGTAAARAAWKNPLPAWARGLFVLLAGGLVTAVVAENLFFRVAASDCLPCDCSDGKLKECSILADATTLRFRHAGKVIVPMELMFYAASAFNRDISGWEVRSVTDMSWMFRNASAFDQDLGWCVADAVFDPYGFGYDTIEDAFAGTACEATSCGVTQGGCP